MHRTLLIPLLTAVLAAGLWAQPPRPPMSTSYWWESKVVVNNLNLTEAQLKQMNETQAAYVGRLMDLRSAVNKAESNFDSIFNQETIDARKADAAVDQLAAARGDLTRTISQLSLSLRKILTSEQWDALRDQQSSRAQKGPFPGRGRRGAGAGPNLKNGSGPPTAPVK
ncbi:MAG TPA: periplasmic heavy metal sensor [Bryobacteraceae bacterium]|jgi:Spy/CpxP family protein refolding chaperone